MRVRTFDLSEEEGRLLREILADLSSRADQSMSLSQLLDDWQSFVTRVDRGYDDSIYEYTNDLSIRDLLAKILERSPVPLAGKLRAVIDVWDLRFEHTTIPASRSLAAAGKPAAAWWWLRGPMKLRGDLKRDLESERLV
jgi:hypothetical protein